MVPQTLPSEDLISPHLMCPGPILRWLPGPQPPGPPSRHNLKLSATKSCFRNDGDQVLEVGSVLVETEGEVLGELDLVTPLPFYSQSQEAWANILKSSGLNIKINI